MLNNIYTINMACLLCYCLNCTCGSGREIARSDYQSGWVSGTYKSRRGDKFNQMRKENPDRWIDSDLRSVRSACTYGVYGADGPYAHVDTLQFLSFVFRSTCAQQAQDTGKKLDTDGKEVDLKFNRPDRMNEIQEALVKASAYWNSLSPAHRSFYPSRKKIDDMEKLVEWWSTNGPAIVSGEPVKAAAGAGGGSA